MLVLALLQEAAKEAEPSKVPFFIAGGLLACWAIVMFAVGMRSETFPGGQTGERGVIAVSVVLVAAAMATAVITA
jgi:hypothetical protein